MRRRWKWAEWAAVLGSLMVAAACGAGNQATRGQRATAREDTLGERTGGERAKAAVWRDSATLTGHCDGALGHAAALRADLKAAAERPDGAILERFNQMLRALDTASGWAALMFSVHPDKALREAGQQCQERLAAFATEVTLDRGLYDVVAGVDRGALEGVAGRFVDHVLRDFRRGGVDKDEATRARLASIDKEMVRLGQEFQQNVRDDVRHIDVDGAQALRGLPSDYLASHLPGDDGKIRITTDYPDFFPVQTYAEDGDVRRRLYEVFMNRGYPKNEALLRRLLALRHEYARLLGHATWAAYNAEDKMAKSADTVERFIRDVAAIARPRMERDMQTLLERKREDDERAQRIEVWDRFFYVGKVREARYGFDSRTVRPYFPYVQVRQGILDLYGELFGLRFVPNAGEAVWHEQVEAFDLLSGQERIGRFYLDMHPREGKYKHAAMFPIRTGLEGADLPVAALVCNFPDPRSGAGQALMEHEDVVTFFHEFGHLIHHLLARKGPWVNLAGINVEWDFVEAPSQILEEWAWDATVLQRFARHVDTAEPIPADAVERMRAAEEFGKGAHVMRQVFYTAYSYFLHAADPGQLDLDEFTDRIYASYSPYRRVPGGHVYANFGHLIGYSSAYYTYQWSLVIAKDLFTRFAASGLMDGDVARQYREAILEPGGTADAAELVERFLGRPFGLEAYRAWLEDQ